MKKIVLATLLLASLSAQAKIYLYRFDEHNIYLRAFGSIGWAEDTEKKYTATSSHLHVYYHPTTHYGFDLGYRHEHWRLEYEFGYYKNNHRSFTLDTVKINNHGDLTIHSNLVNLYYNFSDEYYATIPYFGVGMGNASIKMDGYANRNSATSVNGNESDNVFAYQGVVGISYYLSKNAMVDIAYKHFGTSQADKSIDSEYHSNHVMVGMTYHFV